MDGFNAIRINKACVLIQICYYIYIESSELIKDFTMQNDQLSMFDTPTVIKGHSIECIYVTKGKNTFNQAGQVCDRAAAVQIGGKLHWINKSFATYSDLHHMLYPLGVVVNYVGEYGIKDKDVTIPTPFDHKVVKMRGSEIDIFSCDSSYMNRSERYVEDNIWWTVEQIKNKYFSESN